MLNKKSNSFPSSAFGYYFGPIFAAVNIGEFVHCKIVTTYICIAEFDVFGILDDKLVSEIIAVNILAVIGVVVTDKIDLIACLKLNESCFGLVIRILIIDACTCDKSVGMLLIEDDLEFNKFSV